ncbi:MAG: nuclear transport factor 2 family protein [Bryobacteraceae bacterium]
MDWTGKIAFVCFVGMRTVGFGQDASLKQADAAFLQAAANADRSALEKLLDAEFTWTNASGSVRSRTQVLRDPPKIVIANGENAASKTFVYGNLGIVQVDRGKAHVLRVWVRRPAGWKAIACQEVMSLEAPPSFTPGAGKDCENPCKSIPFTPKNDIERQVAMAYSKLETAAHARNSAAFGPLVGDEFVAVSSNSDKLQTKRSRMAEFDRSKDGGLAPTPLLSARMLAFGDAVLMISEHQPDRGNPLHVTRVWVKREGSWMETLSYQTALGASRSAR